MGTSRCKVKEWIVSGREWFFSGRMSAHDFYRHHQRKMQGLMVVPIGLFLLLAALLCGAWLWSEAVSIAAAPIAFALMFAFFWQADAYYEDFVYRRVALNYAWYGFCCLSAIVLPLGIWLGYGIASAATVGVVWLLMYRRQIGQSWGVEGFSAALLAVSVSVLLALGEPTLTLGGPLVLAIVGGVLLACGVLDWINEIRVARRIKEEANELDF